MASACLVFPDVAAAQVLPISEGRDIAADRSAYLHQTRGEIEHELARALEPAIRSSVDAVLSYYGSEAVYRSPERQLRGENELAEGFADQLPALFGSPTSLIDLHASGLFATSLLRVLDPATGAAATEMLLWERRRGRWTIIEHIASGAGVEPHEAPEANRWRVSPDQGRHGLGTRIKAEAGAVGTTFSRSMPGPGAQSGMSSGIYYGLGLELGRAIEIRGGIEPSGNGESTAWEAGTRFFILPSFRVRPYLAAGVERSNMHFEADVAPSAGFGIAFDPKDWLGASIGGRQVFYQDPSLGEGGHWIHNRTTGSWRISGGIHLAIGRAPRGAIAPPPGSGRSTWLGETGALPVAREWITAMRGADQQELYRTQSEAMRLELPGEQLAVGRGQASAAGEGWSRGMDGLSFTQETFLSSERLAYLRGALTDGDGPVYTLALVLEQTGGSWLVRQAIVTTAPS